MADDYNGWLNFETWNVALWLSNDQALHSIAKGVCRQDGGYKELTRYLKEECGVSATPDGVPYDDKRLDLQSLDEMIRDL